MTQASQPAPGLSADPAYASIFKPRHLTQALVILMGAASCAAFWYLAKAVNWPPEPHFRGSLAQAPVLGGAWVAGLALLVACTFVGTLLLGRRWYLAGLMCATAGLAVWSIRGGTMEYVLFRADATGSRQGIFLRLLGELIVFFGVIAAMWSFLWSRRQLNPLDESEADEQGRSVGAALLAQAGLMGAFLLILVVTARKKQVLSAMFFASWAATGIAHLYFANRKASRWYWVGPFIVGLVGYLANYFSPGGAIEIGQVTGTFAPLGRVLPLDYASIGCAAAILGYWMAEPEPAPADAAQARPTPEAETSGNGQAAPE